MLSLIQSGNGCLDNRVTLGPARSNTGSGRSTVDVTISTNLRRDRCRPPRTIRAPQQGVEQPLADGAMAAHDPQDFLPCAGISP